MTLSPQAQVHPAAIVEAGAVVGAGCIIGPFAVIGPEVTLHPGVIVKSHTPRGRPTVGGVNEEGRTVSGYALLIHAHDDRVRVLRDIEVLGATGR